MEPRFNVLEVTSGKFNGRLRVVPTKRQGYKLQLRGAKWVLCNCSFDFGRAFIGGMLAEREKKGIRPV